MRLFFILVCCLAIPLVARAADQDNNKKKKQATQGQQQQQQKGKRGKHQGANTDSQQNKPSHVKGQGQRHGVSAQNNNVPVVPANTKGKRSQHQEANTASQQNKPAHVKGQGQPRGVSAQNNNVPAVQSRTKRKVETKHFRLPNSPNPRIASATFQKNYRIRGHQNWKGQKYVAFRNYRGEWHDRGWWHNHYSRIVLISGGWYFWNAGYWYPAWGYDSAFSYYPYNGPIYAYRNLPPDQVIANVQSALQAQGYYRGEIDGLLGPLTRGALANYQRDHRLYMTEAIDEPTLESLGMS
jgi:hypothetical protein